MHIESSRAAALAQLWAGTAGGGQLMAYLDGYHPRNDDYVVPHGPCLAPR